MTQYDFSRVHHYYLHLEVKLTIMHAQKNNFSDTGLLLLITSAWSIAYNRMIIPTTLWDCGMWARKKAMELHQVLSIF